MSKRLALFLLLVLLGRGTLAEGALCVRAPGVAALTDEQGVELIENGRFDDIFAVREGELYAAGSAGDYRLFDASGRQLSDNAFAMIDDGGKALVYRTGGLYGAMDDTGASVVPAEWTQLTCDGAGGFLAMDDDPLDETPDELIHLSADGEATRTGVFVARGLSRVADGRMPYATSAGLCGAVDAAGNIAIEPTWRSLGAFEDGLAKVAGEDGMGVIDVDGNVVVPPVYAWLERSGTMIVGCGADTVDVYVPDGSVLAYSLDAPDSEVYIVGDCLAVLSPEGSRLYGADGAVVAERAAGTTFAAGAAGQFIASDGPWGEPCQWLIGPDGQDASGRFQQLLPLCPGRYAWLRLNGTEYYSDELGRIQTSWDYAGQRFGLADGAGNVLLDATCRDILPVEDMHLALVGDGEVSLVDLAGNVLRTWVTAASEESTGEAGA